MEVAARVQTRNLSPGVRCDIVYFALVHRLTWQRTSYRINLRSATAGQYRCQRMRSTLKDHIASLLKPFIDKLVAALGRLARFPASRQEDSAFFVFDRHEVGGDFDVDNIGSV